MWLISKTNHSERDDFSHKSIGIESIVKKFNPTSE